jgi:hypothetical protein
MRKEKAKKSPAPGAYEIPKQKIPAIPKSTEVQRLMVADSQFKA